METTNVVRKTTTTQIVRKRKKVRSSSSSSSSSSDSGSSSDSSSSSSSKDSPRKGVVRKGKPKRRNSSSSDERSRSKKVIKTKRVCHKKLDATKLKAAQAKKILVHQSGGGAKVRKRSQSQEPVVRKRTVDSPSVKASGSHKIPIKSKLSAEALAKHHRMKEVAREREREREFQLRERDREREREKERERLRSRDKDRMRSRSPRGNVLCTPTKRLSRSRDIKQRLSPQRRPPSKSRSGGGSVRRDRSIDRLKKDFKRHETSRERERDRREREREAIREKERQEILARCQERHERERLAREKNRKIERDRDDDRPKTDRLLPRPAERAMALAAARDRSREKSDERDRPRPHDHGRGIPPRDRGIREKEMLYEREYDRDDPRYDHHRRLEKEDRPIIRDERDRDYMVVRRREDGRGDHPIDNPYLPREKRPDRDDILDRDPYHNVMGGVDQRYDEHMLRDDRRGGSSARGMPHEYGSRGGGYIDERSHRAERERDWARDPEMVRDDRGGIVYDRHTGVRDWDRNEMTPTQHGMGARGDNYADSREWNDRQWDAGLNAGSGNVGPVGNAGSGNWQQQEGSVEKWDNPEDKEWQDYHVRMPPEKIHHEGDVPPAIGGVGGRGSVNRRWNSWRGRRGNQHHHGGNDFRRQNIQHHGHQEGGFQERGDMPFRRHQHSQNEGGGGHHIHQSEYSSNF